MQVEQGGACIWSGLATCSQYCCQCMHLMPSNELHMLWLRQCKTFVCLQHYVCQAMDNLLTRQGPWLPVLASPGIASCLVACAASDQVM